MVREFVCSECGSEKGRGCRFREEYFCCDAVPAYCLYDGGRAKWREVVPDV